MKENKNKEYPGISFTTWSCTKCGELFRIEQQQEGTEGPIACPICGYTCYSKKGFEKILEDKYTKEQQENLEELKHHLQKAIYRSRKL